ncbi:lantibiotic dehydratase family protein [Flavobacterium piscisymbiosum]|uniref:Lantibiotic dehydratase family protein n=1 Tax=Flavobacterium piscisymbiosum TaxID=2893753 RepID=A0ABS8ME05_9FLAO|nr:lantibiotic dehydratase family protein [Flavobacterium sp. F-30]MCC9063588.1 lantibiotic dehydratase family protein [Flavobacterium sp. F-30]
MNKNFPYKNFSKYILRVPLLSFSLFQRLTDNDEISDEELKLFCKSPLVKESIFLASPLLYSELEKWLSNNDISEKKNQKLRISLLKYISRMCSRCTPYGLFAGVTVGNFESFTNVELKNIDDYSRKTRLDMNYLVQLSQQLSLIPVIKKQLKYYSNSSIYRIGSKVRFIEYKYVNNRRIHQISEVDQTDYLDEILNQAKSGILISDLISILTSYEADQEEAYLFAEELINSQLLISEMEPSVSGPDIFDQILNILRNFSDVDGIVEKLLMIKTELETIDNNFGNEIERYEIVKNLIIDFINGDQIDSLFQTDLAVKSHKNMLDQKIIDSLVKGAVLLNKLTPSPRSTTFEQFKNAFQKRYENQEVSLTHVLDTEIGIGYVQDKSNMDINPLLDNLSFSDSNINSGTFWTTVQLYFFNVIKDALAKNIKTIILEEKDFEHLEENWDDFPDTLTFPVEMVMEDQKCKVKLKHGASLQAADLLSRFCYVDSELHSFVNEIVKKETELNADQIIAEIIHLPESRIGNVLMRPDFREFEISYLTKSIKEKDNQIFIEDLMISLKQGKIVLRCKRNNREIFPKLSTAHNFSYNSLPMYHFLSDFKNQGTRYGIRLDLAPLYDVFDFIPRIEYNNVILHAATWFIKHEKLEKIIEISPFDKQLICDEMLKLRTSLQIPQYVLLNDSDNELLINLRNVSSIKLLLNMVKNKGLIKVSEFLHDKESLVRKNEEHYTNEVIVGFYKDKKFKQKL